MSSYGYPRDPNGYSSNGAIRTGLFGGQYDPYNSKELAAFSTLVSNSAYVPTKGALGISYGQTPAIITHFDIARNKPVYSNQRSFSCNKKICFGCWKTKGEPAIHIGENNDASCCMCGRIC